MASFNKVILMGNLTKDPEIRAIPNGTAVANFRIAVNHRYKQGEETKDDVCFIDIVTFGKQAENCGQFLHKGNGIIVDGRLQERRWETPEGQKRSKLEVIAQGITFLPKKEQSGDKGDAAGEEVVDSDDVPF